MDENRTEEISKSSLETQRKSVFCQINKEMIRYKFHFFLAFGGLGCVLPYLPVLAKNRIGLSATSLGATLTAQQFITVLSKPAIGYIADYFNKLKIIISVLIIFHAIFLFLLFVIPPIQTPQKTSSVPEQISTLEHFEDCNYDAAMTVITSEPVQYCESSFSNDVLSWSPSQLKNTTNYTNNKSDDIKCTEEFKETPLFCVIKKTEKNNNEFQLYINCSNASTENNSSIIFRNKNFQFNNLESILLREAPNRTFRCAMAFREDGERRLELNDLITNEFHTLQFWIFSLILIITGTCNGAFCTLGDTACCESVQKFGSDFGRQRLFGSVGWGVLAPICGLLIDVTNDFMASWILFAFVQALALWNISKLDLVKPHFSHNIFKDVGTVFNSSEFLMFELGVLMNGIAMGIGNYYLIWFVSSLGGSKFLCGMVEYMQCFAAEIPFMFFSGWLIKKVGHFNLLSLSLVAHFCRSLWYSYLKDPWLVLPVEILHGFTYGTFLPAVASYGKKRAKPGTEATTQSILFSTYEGLGQGIGCLLAGVGFDHLGGHQTFFYSSIFSLCAALVNIINTFLKRYCKNH